ncbi:hypothetical protein FB565_007741 [Actinoplanes lutulentus]|nr:DUF6461 domain-containing protein [Actinoplanes lutulentus]MBB2947970.1 hypothetical protein [Actinoplanes lutulentus]
MVAVSADDYAWFTEQYAEIAGTCRLTLVRGRTPTEVLEQLGGSAQASPIGVRHLTEQLTPATARFAAAAAFDGWTLLVEPDRAPASESDARSSGDSESDTRASRDDEPDARASRQLSRETVLVAHSAESFLWARDGEILLQFDPADPTHRTGTDPNTLTPALNRLGFDTGEPTTAGSTDSDAGWGDAARHRERSLALAEQLTGVRITLEALEAATFSCATLPTHDEPGHPAPAGIPSAQSVAAQSVAGQSAAEARRPSARPERWDEEYDAPAEDDDWSDPDTDEPDGDTDDREWPRLLSKVRRAFT